MALLCSAYKLANCSSICVKYFTLVFLAALGLDFQAALGAYDNICTPFALELALLLLLFCFSNRGSILFKPECPREAGSFDSCNLFQIQNKEPTSFFNPAALIPLWPTLPDTERRFNLNLMSVTDELAIKGRMN